MGRTLQELQRFFRELKRRHVYRVAATYAVVAFVVIQVADLTFVRLGFPPWTVTFVIALSALGFPVAVVLAWAFEMTPEGVRRTGPGSGEGEEEGAEKAAGATLNLRTVLLLAVGLVILPAGGWWLQRAGDGGAAGVNRLAVLPLANLMNDPSQEYFVRGMHSELISELQRAGMPVIARTSVMRYADEETPAREIARELGVDALVEGSVLRIGEDSVEIDAGIVSPETEEYLWSATFASSLREIESLHRDVTREISDAIQAVLAPEDESRLAGTGPVHPRAYEAYLRGEFHLQRFSPEDFEAALKYYRRSLAIDSTYAPAFIGVARVWSYRAQARGLTGVTAAEARRHWEPALERALALDSTLAIAYAYRAATTAWADWSFDEALGQFRRALELNPGLARQRMFYSHLLTILGDWEEARRQAERAVETDPLNPFVQGLYGVHLTMTRRHREAIRVLEEMYRTFPGANFGRSPLISAYEEMGRYGDALRLHEERFGARGDTEVVAALERGYREGGSGRDGYREAVGRAADILAARRRAAEGTAGAPWRLYASAGEEEEALYWLARAVDERNQNMPYIGVVPGLEPLHDRPRFRELAAQVGVPLLTGPRGDGA